MTFLCYQAWRVETTVVLYQDGFIYTRYLSYSNNKKRFQMPENLKLFGWQRWLGGIVLCVWGLLRNIKVIPVQRNESLNQVDRRQPHCARRSVPLKQLVKGSLIRICFTPIHPDSESICWSFTNLFQLQQPRAACVPTTPSSKN